MRSPWTAHLASSVDLLINASFVLIYCYDGSIVTLVLRAVGQLQFSNPAQAQPTRPLHYFGIACCASNALAFVVHLFTDFRRPRRGLLLDFIGQGEPDCDRALQSPLTECSMSSSSRSQQLTSADYLPPKPAILLLDLAIFAVQMFFVLISYDNMSYHTGVARGEITQGDTDDDATSDLSEDDETLSDADAMALASTKRRMVDPAARPIVQIDLRTTLRRLLLAASDVDKPGDTPSARRRRGRRRALSSRLDEASDEERNVGMRRASRV